ncbi:MAG TPA: TetR/AcrR family transcriptional regulator [Microbacterium sp.]|nr:TetR/AcrR family transcriptional regulator [Microbacterium sp.]
MAGPRGEYKKSAQRREQILDAAFDVFSRSGYTAGSVSEIARQVGISQTSVVHHFAGGKIALLQGVLERRDTTAENSLENLEGRAFLAGLVAISRNQAGQRGVVQLYRILSTEATDPDHPAHGYFRARSHRIADAVTHAFAQAEDAGDLRDGVEPHAAALATLAMTEGLEMLWLYGHDVDMAEDVRRFISTFLVQPL